MITAKVLPDCTLGESAEKAFRRELARHVGYTVVISDIKRYQAPRSNQQCRLVMGFYMKIILKEAGYGPHEKEAVYQGIKLQCWYKEVINEKTGQVLRIPKSTRDLDKPEYSKFIQVFKDFVWDFFGIMLPEADAAMAML